MPSPAKKVTPTSASRTATATTKGGHKSISKKELTNDEKIRRFFRTLCAQIDGGHFKNALKTCDKILRINASDEDTVQAKIFLLLQTEQYETALAVLDSLNTNGAREFEKAYALYRLHRESEATKVLAKLKLNNSSEAVDRGINHLEAQLDYRQSSYQSAFDHYTGLLDSAIDSDEHADVLTNLNAAQAHLDFLTTGYLHALDALPASVINTLETAPPPPPPGSSMITILARASAPVAAPSVPIEKKVRTKRVPKGVVPGVTPPPDPERWIKKSERSNFGQGAGRRRKGAGGGATQGSVAEVSPSHASKSNTGKSKKKK